MMRMVKIIIMILILIILKHRHKIMGVVGGCETNGRLISRPEYKEGYTDTLGFVRISLRNVSYTTIE